MTTITNSPLNNSILKENIKKAIIVLEEVEHLKSQCIIGLELMIKEICDKHAISFNTGMGSWSFDFVINDTKNSLYEDCLSKRKNGKNARNIRFKSTLELENNINDTIYDINNSIKYNDLENKLFLEEELLILKKVKSFYEEFQFLLKEVERLDKIFNHTEYSMFLLAKSYNYEDNIKKLMTVQEQEKHNQQVTKLKKIVFGK